MASVFKSNERSKKSDPWIIEYTDHNGKRIRVTGYKDKRLSEQRGAKLEHEARLRRDGLIDPKEEKRVLNESLPIAKHLAAFKKSLGKNSAKHVKLTMSRVNRIIEKGVIESIADIDSESVEQAMDETVEEDGIGHRTYNHYLQAFDSFCNWMVPKRIPANPIAGMERKNAATDVRHKRRALSVDEVRQLLKSARESNELIQCYTGEERARFYLLSFMTGLRRKELGSLTKKDFKLKASLPILTVEADFAKAGRKDVLPLHPELIPELKKWLKDLGPNDKLFPKLEKRRTWLCVKKDLERIGIPYKTHEGIADFHAAGRHSHISGLLESGASLAETKELARHTDVRMTMKYAHLGMDTKAKAISSLPSPTTAMRDDWKTDEGKKSENQKGEQTPCSEMRSISEPPTCLPGSSAVSDCPDTSANPKKITPGDSGGYVSTSPSQSSSGIENAHRQKVEAAGIEPASRDISTSASTCVVVWFSFAPTITQSTRLPWN